MESLGGKVIAVDASIWIYQFQMAMRDKEGNALRNAHILGFLRRLVKLLFFGVKPIFVFDGGAPVLKKITIGERKERKQGGAENLARTAEKLLAAQMRAAAVKQAIENKRAAGEPVEGEDDAGVILGEDTVYYDENASAGVAAPALVQTPQKKQKKDWHRDQYDLPPLVGATIQASAPNDARFATEDELKDFIDEMRPEDFDMDSDLFRRLPTEVQYEVIGDLRLKSRQTSFKRLEAMLRSTKTSFDFSQLQIKNLMQRNDLTQKLLTVTDNIGKANVTIPLRIAGERSREYVLIKRDEAGEGGGWALGVRTPQGNGTKQEPVKIDTDSASATASLASDSEDDTAGSADFEEVSLPMQTPQKGPQSSPEARSAERRRLAYRALERKYGLAGSRHSGESDKTRDLSSKSDAPLFLNDAVEKNEQTNGTDSDTDIAQNSPPSRPNFANGLDRLSPRADVADDDDLDLQEALLSAAKARPESVTRAGPSKPAVRQARSESPTEPPKVRDFGNDTVASEVDTGKDKGKAREVPVPSPTSKENELDLTSPSPPAKSPTRYYIDSDDQDMEEVQQQNNFKENPPKQLVEMRQQRGQSPPTTTETGRTGIAMGDVDEVRAVRDTQPEVEELSEKAVPDITNDLLPARDQATESPSAAINDSQIIESEASEQINSDSIDSHQREKTPAQETRAPSHASEESDHELEWSPSPPPAAAATRQSDADLFGLPPEEPTQPESSEIPKDFPFLDTEDPYQFDSGGEEEQANPAEEQDEFAKFLSSVKGASLESVQGELDKEIHDLNKLRVQHRRDADDISQVMVTEIQTLLRYFGIPYITAPMEAEAQCAELVSRGLASFCASEDSDLFLFGGTRVLKNVYNQNKYVECYLLSDLERELSLNREKLVQLAFLLGSDYTDGLPSVGPVTAMEILSEFPGQDGLLQFKEWWQKVQSGRDDDADVATKFRRKFKKKMKSILFLHEDWPNPKVIDAYYHPSVDESDQPFVWGIPDLDALREFLTDSQRGLGWSIPKVDELLLPIFKRIHERATTQTMQGTLDQFFDISAGMGHFAPKQRTNYQSERLRKIVEEWRAKQRRLKASAARDTATIEISTDDETEAFPIKAEYEGIEERLIGKAMANVKPIIRRTGATSPQKSTNGSTLPRSRPGSRNGSRPVSPNTARSKSGSPQATRNGAKRTRKRKKTAQMTEDEHDEDFQTSRPSKASKSKARAKPAPDVDPRPKAARAPRRQPKAKPINKGIDGQVDEGLQQPANGPMAIEEVQTANSEPPLFLDDQSD